MDFKEDNIDIKDLIRIEDDQGVKVKLNFKWFNLDELDNINIKPEYLKEILAKDNLEFNHLIIKD